MQPLRSNNGPAVYGYAHADTWHSLPHLFNTRARHPNPCILDNGVTTFLTGYTRSRDPQPRKVYGRLNTVLSSR